MDSQSIPATTNTAVVTESVVHTETAFDKSQQKLKKQRAFGTLKYNCNNDNTVGVTVSALTNAINAQVSANDKNATILTVGDLFEQSISGITTTGLPVSESSSILDEFVDEETKQTLIRNISLEESLQDQDETSLQEQDEALLEEGEKYLEEDETELEVGGTVLEQAELLPEEDDLHSIMNTTIDDLNKENAELNQQIAEVTIDEAAVTIEDLLESTEILFKQVEDKDSVTVKDIIISLCAQYNIPKIDKAWKNEIRQRLAELVTNDVQKVEDPSQEDEESDNDSESELNEENAASDYSDDDKSYQSKSNKKESNDLPRAKRIKKVVAKKMKKPKIDKKIAKAAAAARAHAETLRKRQLAELKVRQEELAVTQQDQERAEQIAAKFDTNTDEQRLRRLEQRLDLLEKLDTKRMAVVQQAISVKTIKDDVEKVDKTDNSTSTDQVVQYYCIDDDDDEMELEIVGGQNSWPKLKSLAKNDPIALLMNPTAFASRPKTNIINEWSARDALKRQLLSKQRQAGNRWLARELGYNTEDAHVQDCLEVERKKHALTLQREAERRLMNEKKAQRQRLLAQGEEFSDESDNDDDKPGIIDENVGTTNENKHSDTNSNVGDNNGEVDSDDDEDEEQAQARQVQEQLNQREDILDNDASLQNFNTPDDDCVDAGLSKERNITNPLCDEEEAKSILSSAADEVDKSLNDTETTSVQSENHHVHVKFNVADVLSQKDNFDKEKNTEEDESSSIMQINESSKVKAPRNSAWKAMLEKEKEIAKRLKKQKSGLLEDEAEEEEDEEEFAGLEDFGFTIQKKKKDDDDGEEEIADNIDDADLEDVVDELSDDEGDEAEGEKARKALEAREEKERHKEVMRRMREGYDGQRGGIAGGGGGARGLHRFDQLVAADNREDAKRLGLLNDDEFDSDVENDDEKKTEADEEEDEAALLDKMLKDRFLHRSSVEMEENFSEDEDEKEAQETTDKSAEDREEQEQERIAKQFSKRARMQRLVEEYGDLEEFSQKRLIDEDESIRFELQRMKNGLSRKQHYSMSQSNTSTISSQNNQLRNNNSSNTRDKQNARNAFVSYGGTLALALQANKHKKPRTTFVRNISSVGNNNISATSLLSSQRNLIASSQVSLFSIANNNNSNSLSGNSQSGNKRRCDNTVSKDGSEDANNKTASLWSRAGLSKARKR